MPRFWSAETTNMSPLGYLLCPICSAHLISTSNSLACANGHTFDTAREGYVNFLRKKLPGDTREMLRARRDFFAQGHYLPISDTLNEIISTHLFSEAKQQDPASPVAILDAGCGEGYYLGRLQAHLAARRVRTMCIGFDVSKEAMRLAARHYGEAFFVVANLKDRLPLAERSFQIILNIFAPRNPQEFARVLAPGGLLLVIIPAPTHLQQLRAALPLLGIEENKQQHVIEQFTTQKHFCLESARPVSYELRLQRDDISRLVTMTPNYWHLSDAVRQEMSNLPEIGTEIACICLAFRRQDRG